VCVFLRFPQNRQDGSVPFLFRI